jgi:hypothetical protein
LRSREQKKGRFHQCIRPFASACFFVALFDMLASCGGETFFHASSHAYCCSFVVHHFVTISDHGVIATTFRSDSRPSRSIPVIFHGLTRRRYRWTSFQ